MLVYFSYCWFNFYTDGQRPLMGKWVSCVCSGLCSVCCYCVRSAVVSGDEVIGKGGCIFDRFSGSFLCSSPFWKTL